MASAVTFLSLLLLQCGDAPEIIFPKTGENAVVSGRVYPADKGGTAYLIHAAGIDSAAINTRTEMFEFTGVSFGTYYLQIKADGYGTTERQLAVNETVIALPLIKLTKQPFLVTAVVPVDGTVIDSAFVTDKANGVNDSAVVVRVIFREEMDTASVRAALGVVPGTGGVRCTWKSDRKSMTVSVPRGGLDGDSDLVITIDTGAADLYGHHLERSLVVSYPVAAGLGRVIAPQYLIASKRPGENEKNVSPSSPVMIWFDSVMHAGSVEEAFSISPAAIPHFIWDTNAGKHRVTVMFPAGLHYGTRYTVSLAAGWRTADSSMVGSTWSFAFDTQLPSIKDFSPQNGQQRVPVTAPLFFTTNFTVGAVPFLTALHFSPEVDSLHFSFDQTLSRIRIDHPVFDSGTVYTVTVDSTLGTPDSNTIGRTVSFTFTTIAPQDELNGADTVTWVSYPAEGSSEWPAGKSISITFGEEMHPAAVESLLIISPEISFYTLWTDPTAGGHRLDIRMRSYLRSNTEYDVAVKPGYSAVSGRKNNGIRFSFTTQPLRCIGHTPAHGEIGVVPDSAVPVSLAFNLPVAVVTLSGALSISPEAVVVRWSENDTADARNGIWNYGFAVTGLLKNTEYKLTVAATVTDLFGSGMRDGAAFSFTTGE
jgi:hypothetical protein